MVYENKVSNWINIEEIIIIAICFHFGICQKAVF